MTKFACLLGIPLIPGKALLVRWLSPLGESMVKRMNGLFLTGHE